MLIPNKEKIYTTVDEQIQILQSRGLEIPDIEMAKDFLSKHNYYRVSGYTLTLRNNDKFFPSATFQNVMDIYNFDHQLRTVLFHYLVILEVNFKCSFTNRLTESYGPQPHSNENIFSDKLIYERTMQKVEKLTNQNMKSYAPLKHYRDELNEPVPFWVLVEIFTLGTISTLFSVSPLEVKQSVAKDFGLNKSKGHELLGKAMRIFTILRNQCAHSNRIYNRRFEQRPTLSKKQRATLRIDSLGQPDDYHLFAYLLLLKQLLQQEDFQRFTQEISTLTNKYPFVAMRYYGFPDHWLEILNKY